MRDTTLVIMAAGIGSRFGGGIKQLASVGPGGEIIMDYSIHDALEAGFNKIIFIIRKDLEKDFKEIIGNRIERVANVEYAFQELDDVPGDVPVGRSKPWGTGQAVLAAREYIHEPFAVINADDYYGKEAFVKMHDWLALDHADTAFAMAGFILQNTLSDNGGVTRGVCSVEAGHTHVVDVVETENIIKLVDESGKITSEADGIAINPKSYVSMNFWGFSAKAGCAPAYMDILADGFEKFFIDEVKKNPLKSEYLLPVHIGGLLREGKCTVKILETHDKWFGVTYKDDKNNVVQSFKQLIADGVYREDLYSDLL